MLKIFYFIGELKFAGGAEHQLYITVKEMKKRGIDPYVFIWQPPSPDNIFLKELKNLKVKVFFGELWEKEWFSTRLANSYKNSIYRLPLKKSYKKKIANACYYIIKRFVKKFLKDYKYLNRNFVKRANLVIKKVGKPDLLHIFGANGALIVIDWAKNQKIPILYVENCQSGKLLANNPDYYNLMKEIESVDRIVSVSEAGKNGLASYWKIRKPIDILRVIIEKPEERVSNSNHKYIYKKKSNNSLVVGTLSRFEEMKGIHLIPQIAKHLVRNYRCEFYLLGYCENMNYLQLIKNEIHKNNLSDSVTVNCNNGFVNLYHLKDFMDSIDIFLLPSYSEGLPGVIIEAMSFKKPIIAADVGSVNQLVEDGLNGFLVNKGDINQFVVKLKNLLENPKLRKQFGQKSYKKYMKHYIPEIVCHDLDKIYKQLYKLGNIGTFT